MNKYPMSEKYSKRLKSMTQELKPALGINYTYFDTFSIFSNIAQNQASYGSHIFFIPLL